MTQAAPATRASRRIPPGLRQEVFFLSGGNCQRCNQPINQASFHVAHLRAASHGGPVVLANIEAWCPPCNLKNGNADVRDTRVKLRPWQEEALPIVMEALSMARVSTVMAAPGAGKTIFAGAVFAAGQDAGLWHRLLVVVPRSALVEQWKRSLLENSHIALDTKNTARQGGREMRGMDGVCITYQGLLPDDARRRHSDAVRTVPTLVVLDEVHHLGLPVADEANAAAWSEAIRDVVGDLRTQLNVAGVLNLSGTLFRTSPKERISTVRYAEVKGERGEDRIQSIADYEIHPERLVREGLLRAPDLYRVGATVEIVNLTTAEVTTGAIADLDDDSAKRLALRQLNLKPEWIQQLVSVTLDQLESRHRDAKRSPVKALIVTHRQDMARQFAQEVDRQMVARQLQPLAEVVVSEDGADAYRRLEKFRLQKRVGVLSTVGMAGEGYDCPDIAVVTYATNVQTAQYIRQVVARGQRVTQWERERVGQPLTTAIILPDVPELVKMFTEILAPMVHDIELPTVADGGSMPGSSGGSGTRAPGWTDKELVSVRDAAVDIVSAISTSGSFDVSPELFDLLAPILREVNLPESSWPRVAQLLDLLNKQRPFEKPVTLQPPPPQRPETSKRDLTPREHHDAIRKKLTRATGWWAAVASRNGGQPVNHFVAEIYRQIGITSLDKASPDQLRRALLAAHERIRRFAGGKSIAVPQWARQGDES